MGGCRQAMESKAVHDEPLYGTGRGGGSGEVVFIISRVPQKAWHHASSGGDCTSAHQDIVGCVYMLSHGLVGRGDEDTKCCARWTLVS